MLSTFVFTIFTVLGERLLNGKAREQSPRTPRARKRLEPPPCQYRCSLTCMYAYCFSIRQKAMEGGGPTFWPGCATYRGNKQSEHSRHGKPPHSLKHVTCNLQVHVDSAISCVRRAPGVLFDAKYSRRPLGSTAHRHG